jgi:hypothetical protein
MNRCIFDHISLSFVGKKAVLPKALSDEVSQAQLYLHHLCTSKLKADEIADGPDNELVEAGANEAPQAITIAAIRHEINAAITPLTQEIQNLTRTVEALVGNVVNLTQRIDDLTVVSYRVLDSNLQLSVKLIYVA